MDKGQQATLLDIMQKISTFDTSRAKNVVDSLNIIKMSADQIYGKFLPEILSYKNGNKEEVKKFYKRISEEMSRIDEQIHRAYHI